MSRRHSIALRLRVLAVFTAMLCTGPLAIVHGRAFAPVAPDAQRFFEGRAFAAALPVALTPPRLDPDVRLVSMIAADIDADGDLDVVANDGSLDLVVWTNDGTGRLTRKYPEPASGGHAELPAPTFADHQAAAEGVPAGGWSCCLRPAQRGGVAVVSAPFIPTASPRSPFSTAVRTPRAPPSSAV